MAELRGAVALFLLLNVLVGLIRVGLGPCAADRMVVAQLMGTTGVAIVVLIAEIRTEALQDVALIFALLSAVAAVAFVRFVTTRAEA